MADLTPTTAVLVVTASTGTLIGSSIAYIAWNRRDALGARPYFVTILLICGWNISTLLLWFSPSFQLAETFHVLTQLFSVGSLVAWVSFVAAYTEAERFAGLRRGLLYGWGVVYSLLLVANPVLELLFTVEEAEFEGLSLVAFEPTPLFVANLFVVFGVVVWSFWLLVNFYRKSIGGRRRQSAVMLVAAGIFVVGIGVYYGGGYSLHPALDPTPLFFTVMIVFVAYALFYYDFLDVKPMATDVLFRVMDDPVIVQDGDGAIIETNDAAESLLATTDEPLETASPALAEALAAGESTVALEMADSDKRVFDLKSTAITDHYDRKQGELVVLRDITVQVERERELERQNERLDEFASTVSHDLRNPLNVAQGRLQMVEEKYDDENLAFIDDSLDRMEALISDLLALARSGEHVSETDSVDLGELAENCWQTVDTMDATLEIEDDTTVRADPDRLRQLFENLVRNAIEHGRDDVTITVGSMDEGFYVADDGPGIPEDERAQVFEHGYTTNRDGTGFGLAIVEDIAEAHGWDITVTESAEGGARFEFTSVGLETQTPLA